MMELQRSMMGSPLPALHIDCVTPVFPVSSQVGRFWLAAQLGWEEVVGRACGGLAGIDGDPLC